MRGDRAQLVLVAAAVIAIALAPVVFAYLQLGYHPDVRASAEYEEPLADAERFLGRAVHEAGTGLDRDWGARSMAVTTVRDRLRPRLRTLERSRVEEGIAYEVSYAEGAARDWAAANCPGGPGKRFGSCEAERGVVVQERAGETTVLAVALEVRATTERGRHEMTVVVPVVG